MPLARFAVVLSLIGALGIAPSLYAGMHWRFVGPLRGGRTTSIAGVPGKPNTFYIGVVNGGIWKNRRCGTHLDADLRRAVDRLDRRAGGRRERSQRRLRRQR